MRKEACFTVIMVTFLFGGCDLPDPFAKKEDPKDLKACVELAKLIKKDGLRKVAGQRKDRFLGKVDEFRAGCRGGEGVIKYQDTPWLDWPNNYAAGDASSKRSPILGVLYYGWRWLLNIIPGIDIDEHLSPNGRGIDGALIDLEYERLELIKFNLFENNTYQTYIQGEKGLEGPVLRVWKEMQQFHEHPNYKDWKEMRLLDDEDTYKDEDKDGTKECWGELIRYRTLTGICNDIWNPLMGSTNMVFARNVQFESTFFPDYDHPEAMGQVVHGEMNVDRENVRKGKGLTRADLITNRHDNRVGLLKPDPQVISRKLFTRKQAHSEACKEGYGLPGYMKEARCDYKKAPSFNVLAAFWIQFMNHDWFSHLEEGSNQTAKEYQDPIMKKVGCVKHKVKKVKSAEENEWRDPEKDWVPVMGDKWKYDDEDLTPEDIDELGCRSGDQMDKALIAGGEPKTFDYKGKTYLARAPKTFKNTVTAWWDASQMYGYDETSLERVRKDPKDKAKLLMIHQIERPEIDRPGEGEGEKQGYLPLLEYCSKPAQAEFPCSRGFNDAWVGQEATAFPDNWTVGLSFYHNLFAREHNFFVDAFRKKAKETPKDDSGLRNPADPDKPILYKDVTEEELFQVARLVVSAEIAKIHTIEWTPQLLYNDPLYRGMNSNWSGLFTDKHPLVAKALKHVANKLSQSEQVKKKNVWYTVFAAGPGIFGLGNKRYDECIGIRGPRDFSNLNPHRPINLEFIKSFFSKDKWSLGEPCHVNGGVNHFGSPFNFPEEFITVYRLHPLLPDLLEYREWKHDSNVIRHKIPVVTTFRKKATQEMRSRGLANWALSMGRQRLGTLTLQNHPQFLQNLKMPKRLQGIGTEKIDVAALDLIRDRERGIPRYNEFRRQLGLKQLTSFDDFVDKHLPPDSNERKEQADIVKILREVYGQHICNDSNVITVAQVHEDGSPITDCLSWKNPDGTMVDNIEDVDTVVGWLAESTRPHGFAISETQFVVFILNASRRLYSDRFLTSSFRPEFYTYFGFDWVNNNGPDGKKMGKGKPNGHEQEVLPLKRVLLRTMPELAGELENVVNVFDPWARNRGEYYSLAWCPRRGAESDEAFDLDKFEKEDLQKCYKLGTCPTCGDLIAKLEAKEMEAKEMEAKEKVK